MGDEMVNVIMRSDILKKLKLGLNDIKLMSENEEVINKADKLLELLKNKNNKEDSEFLSVEETIYRKMKSTNDKDLNVRLYMLYRKLQDGKIDEEEALRLYEVYVDAEYDDKLIY